MTIINGIEIDLINYKKNEIKYAIQNNEPIEEYLNIIIVISNPCLYASRYKLFKEFIKRLENEETNIKIYVVELIYPNQKFIISNSNNKNHLQIYTDIPLWHKENMINLGVKLLPKDYKAFAWIDADIEFESSTWVIDTLKILNGCKDVVQLFSHCVDMDKDESTMNNFTSFGYSYCKNKKYGSTGLNYWHPGYAWAITRKAYEKIGGLLDKGILGSGDFIMANSFIGMTKNITYNKLPEDYKNSMLEFEKKANKLRLGYVPGIIRHYFHGKKINRKYCERTEILIKYNYSPIKHIMYDKNGIITPTDQFTDEFKKDILNYFKERKEDE